MTNLTVWRYEIPPLQDEVTLHMPEGAQILTVQRRDPYRSLFECWALVNPAAPSVPRRLYVVGTGNPMPNSDVEYLGTVQIEHGALVFHVFEAVAP